MAMKGWKATEWKELKMNFYEGEKVFSQSILVKRGRYALIKIIVDLFTQHEGHKKGQIPGE